MTLKAIETAAMKLPSQARSKLAAALLSTLDADDSIETERTWVEEADRRYRAYQTGRTTAVGAKQAIAEVRSALRT
jgi:Putative addiction module component